MWTHPKRSGFVKTQILISKQLALSQKERCIPLFLRWGDDHVKWAAEWRWGPWSRVTDGLVVGFREVLSSLQSNMSSMLPWWSRTHMTVQSTVMSVPHVKCAVFHQLWAAITLRFTCSFLPFSAQLLIHVNSSRVKLITTLRGEVCNFSATSDTKQNFKMLSHFSHCLFCLP